MVNSKKYKHGSLITWGPAILVMAVIFAFSSIPSENVPNFGRLDLSIKKGGHVLGYALLGQAFLWALGRERPMAIRKAWFLAVLYAITDEFHQSFVPGREAWVVDIVIDAIGALFGLLPTIIQRYLIRT